MTEKPNGRPCQDGRSNDGSATSASVAHSAHRSSTESPRLSSRVSAGSVLDAALDYAQHGFDVFPARVNIAPDGKKKVFPIQDWDSVSTTDPEEIKRWFGLNGPWKSASVCIDTGKSGIVVADLDGDVGINSWRNVGVEADFVVRTPGGGEHHYFRADPGFDVGNSTSKVAPKVDVRGVGGFVIAPPSRDARGRYQVVRGSLDNLTPVPDVIRHGSAHRKEREQPKKPSTGEFFDAFDGPRTFTVEQAQEFVREPLEALRNAVDGTINDALNTAAACLSHFIPEFFSEEEATEWLVDAQRRPYHDDDETAARRTIKSGLYPADSWKAVRVDLAAEAAASGEFFDRAVAERAFKMRVEREARRLLAREAQAIEPPEFVSLEDLLSQPDDPVRYRVEGLWPVDGRVMLSAPAKSGKSHIVGNLVRHLVDGGLFLDKFEVNPIDARVAIIDNELGQARLRRWMRDYAVLHRDKVVLADMRGKAVTFDILDDATRTRWAKMLREAGVEVLVLDCLRPVLDAIGLDENHEAGRFLTAFDALLAEAGISESVIVHHTGHAGERARGDSRLRDWPDAEWQIVREKRADGSNEHDSNADRYFKAFGRDVDQPEGRLLMDFDTRRLFFGNGNRAQAKEERKTNQGVSAVLAALREMSPEQFPEGMKSNEVAAAVGGNRRAALDALKEAVRRGLVTQIKGPGRTMLHRLAGPESGHERGDW